jgi:hypothetical protein
MHILLFDERCLSTNLSTNLIVRKTSSREKGDFLSSSNGVHDIDSRDTSLDHLLGINSLERVDGLSLYKYFMG